MKPKIIELKQAPVVLVELSEEADYKVYGDEVVIGDHVLSRKEYKGVGILSDLTEEQFAECVDRTKTHPKYWNYNLNYFREFRASDSFDSLLESENVYTENPHGSKPTPMDYAPYCHIEGGNTTAAMSDDDWKQYETDLQQWQEAQSRTIDPKRTIVLLKK